MHALSVFFFSDRNTLAAAIFIAVAAAGIKFVADYQLQLRTLRKQRLQDQIQELYGPLFSIVGQLTTCSNIKNAILAANPLTDEQRVSMERFMRYKYFLPLHNKINDLLASKLYLIRDLTIPPSFEKYLRSSRQEEIQARLYDEVHVGSDRLLGIPYPDQFDADITNGLANTMDELGITLKSIGP
jgi:hypothetical protein